MANPVGDYIQKTGGTTEFSAFQPGDIILVAGTGSNNGVYTVKQISDDGSVSFMTVSGGTLANEAAASAHKISAVRPYGDKLVALGDVDNGEVDIWSYNSAASDSGESSTGWSSAEITPVISGTNAKFIYYFADEALRVCDINVSNTSQIKWYGYVSTTQFDNDNTGAIFNGFEESPNYLPGPTAGNYASSGSYANIAEVDSAATIDETVDDSETVIDIDNVTKVYPGLVLHIGTKAEYMMVRKVVATSTSNNDGTMTVYRGYGGSTITTHSAADIIYKMGLGFNIKVAEDTTADVLGTWEKKDWQFSQSFIYDKKQESKLEIMSSTFDNTGGNADKKLTVDVYATQMYPSRVTGGRIYIRENGSSDPWLLLMDIDLSKGARTSLDEEYTVWSAGGSANNMAKWNVANLHSNGPALDTYESLNGIKADVKSIGLGKTNERFQAAVIANSRCFLANVARETDSDDLAFVDNFGDRIYFSEIGKYDSFPSDNYIDVSKGDAEAYTHLESYADRILAYKHNTLHIINISSPSPTGWFLEQSLKFMGVDFPHNVTKTDFGIAWVNPQGCYIYDGNRITNLIDGKIKDNGDTYLEVVNDASTIWTSNLKALTWDKFVRGASQNANVNVGYHPKDKMLIIQRSPSDGTTYSNITYIYDFGAKAWVLNDNFFADSGHYTNFQVDWEKDLFLGVKNSTNIEFKKIINEQAAQDDKVFITKDIDFGQPSMNKKVYAVYMTYYASGAIVDTDGDDIPLQYAINGGVNWTNFDTSTVGGSDSTSQLQVSGTGSGEHWDIAKFSLTAPVTCQSIKLKMDADDNSNARILNINDLSIEFRMLRKKVS